MRRNWDRNRKELFAHMPPDEAMAAELKAIMDEEDRQKTPEDYARDVAYLRAHQPPKQPAASRPLRVAVELGHGGGDPGAPGADRQGNEVDLPPQVARWLAARSGNGIQYEFRQRPSREHSTKPLASLAENVRHSQPDIVIALHGNAVKADPTASGAAVYYEPTVRASSNLAGLIAREGKASGEGLGGSGKTIDPKSARELHYKQYAPLYGAKHAGVLVEMGFVSNPEEWRRMQSPAFGQQVAEQLDRAVRAFANQQGLLPPASPQPARVPLPPGHLERLLKPPAAAPPPGAGLWPIGPRLPGVTPGPLPEAPPMPTVHIAPPGSYRRR